MNEVIASFFIDVHQSKAKLTIFHDCNCFLNTSTVHEYSLRQMLMKVLEDSSTSSHPNALYDRHSSWFDIVLRGMWDEEHANMT